MTDHLTASIPSLTARRALASLRAPSPSTTTTTKSARSNSTSIHCSSNKIPSHPPPPLLFPSPSSSSSSPSPTASSFSNSPTIPQCHLRALSPSSLPRIGFHLEQQQQQMFCRAQRSHSHSSGITAKSSTTVNWTPAYGVVNVTGKNNAGSSSGGFMAFLQRALCIHQTTTTTTTTTCTSSSSSSQNNTAKSQQPQRSSFTRRESPDSGLELERLENGGVVVACGSGGEVREVVDIVELVEEGKRKEQNDGTEGTKQEQSNQQQNQQQNQQNQKQKPTTTTISNTSPTRSSRAPPSSSSFSSLGRSLFGSFLAISPPPMMFDFPSMGPLPPLGALDPNGYAHSPVGQLSRSNAVLMRENQQLSNKVQDLENSLRDHVAHLNSVYFTLHQRYGFDALQLPGGEIVHLSQFKGPEVVLLTFVHKPQQQQQQKQQHHKQQQNFPSLQQLHHRHSLDAQLCAISAVSENGIFPAPDTTIPISPRPEARKTSLAAAPVSNRRARLLLQQQQQQQKQQQQQIRHRQLPPPLLLTSCNNSCSCSSPSQQQHSPPSASGDSAYCSGLSSSSVEHQTFGPTSAECSSLSAACSSSASSIDPVEMLRQLCIRPLSAADQHHLAEREQTLQAYMGWLREEANCVRDVAAENARVVGGGEEEEEKDEEDENEEFECESEKQRLKARLRAQQVQAQVQQQKPQELLNGRVQFTTSIDETARKPCEPQYCVEGWRSARAETAPVGSIEESLEKSENDKKEEKGETKSAALSTEATPPANSRATWPPRFPLLSKSRRLRSQLLGGSHSRRSLSPCATPGATSALLSGNHRKGGGGGVGGRCSPLSGCGGGGDDHRGGGETRQQQYQALSRSPRRGIGPMATAACRKTLWGSSGTQSGTARRNLL